MQRSQGRGRAPRRGRACRAARGVWETAPVPAGPTLQITTETVKLRGAAIRRPRPRRSPTARPWACAARGETLGDRGVARHGLGTAWSSLEIDGVTVVGVRGRASSGAPRLDAHVRPGRRRRRVAGPARRGRGRRRGAVRPGGVLRRRGAARRRRGPAPRHAHRRRAHHRRRAGRRGGGDRAADRRAPGVGLLRCARGRAGARRGAGQPRRSRHERAYAALAQAHGMVATPELTLES